MPLNKYCHLEFRAGAIIGPNAIAFPGGIIVKTDEMVESAAEMEEVLAMLAHEIGHVEHRHTMRNVLQNSAIGVVVATTTSDAASLSAAVAILRDPGLRLAEPAPRRDTGYFLRGRNSMVYGSRP